ncbi:hypothetical protein BLA29_002254 [Euroglyphus maynei]|uniref:Uncharacterized protein n=1 Tax=Euroglyphus maynei TaxID=6958 RepID=A0A1Y3AS78_EURMA|nr:hypothetical protein BLA29_002254 [Euroglyphus maynei]
MASQMFYSNIILFIIILISNYQMVVNGANLNYEDCGVHNVYSVNVNGCDEQRSTDDECVIVNKNSIQYYVTFAATTSARILFNNETFQQSDSSEMEITNIVGDLCQNPSKYDLDKCPIEANHILRIHKSINYLNKLPLNYQLILKDRYFSSNDPRQNSRLIACSQIRLRYYDSQYTTTDRPDRHTTNRPDDNDEYREWLEILTRVLRQSEELTNKTETKLRQYFPHQNSSDKNPIIKTLETQLIQLRIDITGIWLDIRHRLKRSNDDNTDMREFRLFVERSTETLWKHGEQLRLTLYLLDEFDWDFHNETNEWISKQISPILEQLSQRLRTMYGYLEQHHLEGNDQSRIEEFIEIINDYSDYINQNRPEKFDENYLDRMLIYVRYVEDRLFEMERKYYGDNYYHYDDDNNNDHYSTRRTMTTPRTTRRFRQN